MKYSIPLTDKHEVHNFPFEVFAADHLAIDAEMLHEGFINNGCGCCSSSNDQVIAAKKEKTKNH